MTTKQDLHRPVDQLPDSAVSKAQNFLEILRDQKDPVLKALLRAPEDDDPETEEERLAVEEALEDIRNGRVYPSEEVKARLFVKD